jgi:hypothetical protein
MSRRRWVYTDGGRPLPEPVEVTEDWHNPGNELGHKSEAEVYGNLQATDGTDLSSRRKHREYMKRNGLTISEDYRQTWAKAAQERADVFNGTSTKDKKARREAVERAVYEVTNNRRGK